MGQSGYAAVALGVRGTDIAPGERRRCEVYDALRERLRDELGAAPAPELRALQEQLLRR